MLTGPVWKDEHGFEALAADPRYPEFESTFFKSVALPDSTIHNVPVHSALPLREVLEAGVVFASYCRLGPDQTSNEWITVTERLLKELDYPGWQGGAYLSPLDTGGEALSFGGWDSVEVSPVLRLSSFTYATDMNSKANDQLFADGRFVDLMDMTNPHENDLRALPQGVLPSSTRYC